MEIGLADVLFLPPITDTNTGHNYGNVRQGIEGS